MDNSFGQFCKDLEEFCIPLFETSNVIFLSEVEGAGEIYKRFQDMHKKGYISNKWVLQANNRSMCHIKGFDKQGLYEIIGKK